MKTKLQITVFWKTIKLFLTNKIVSKVKLTLSEKDEIAASDINYN